MMASILLRRRIDRLATIRGLTAALV